jgi:hypothetical protein
MDVNRVHSIVAQRCTVSVQLFFGTSHEPAGGRDTL